MKFSFLGCTIPINERIDMHKCLQTLALHSNMTGFLLICHFQTLILLFFTAEWKTQSYVENDRPFSRKNWLYKSLIVPFWRQRKRLDSMLLPKRPAPLTEYVTETTGAKIQQNTSTNEHWGHWQYAGWRIKFQCSKKLLTATWAKSQKCLTQSSQQRFSTTLNKCTLC